MNLFKIAGYLQKNDKRIKFMHSSYSCRFQIGRTVFSPLFTLFLFAIQSHRITWLLFNKFLFLSTYEFYRISLKSKIEMAKRNPSKNQQKNFFFKFTIFLILVRVNVTPVKLVLRHFFHSKLRHNYAGRHSLSHIGANGATPCQNDIPSGNNSLFPF